MILTHKTVQTAQGKAPQEVNPVPVEPSVLSKGMEKDSQGNIIYPYFAMKYDVARDEKTFPYEHPDIADRDAHYMTQINDWYMHFNNYRDKTAVIEEDFLTIDGHYFTGYSWRYMDSALWEQGYLRLLHFKERCAQLKIHI